MVIEVIFSDSISFTIMWPTRVDICCRSWRSISTGCLVSSGLLVGRPQRIYLSSLPIYSRSNIRNRKKCKGFEITILRFFNSLAPSIIAQQIHLRFILSSILWLGDWKNTAVPTEIELSALVVVHGFTGISTFPRSQFKINLAYMRNVPFMHGTAVVYFAWQSLCLSGSGLEIMAILRESSSRVSRSNGRYWLKLSQQRSFIIIIMNWCYR